MGVFEQNINSAKKVKKIIYLYFFCFWHSSCIYSIVKGIYIMSMLEYTEFYHADEPVGVFDFYSSLTPDRKDFKKIFNRNKIYCPECRVCQLKLTQETISKTAFLSKMPGENNKHSDWCSHNHQTMKNSEAIKYYGSLSNEEILEKLEKTIYLLLSPKVTNNHKKTVPTYDNPTLGLIQTTNRKNEETMKALPKMSFYDPRIINVPENYYHIPFLLYGDVYLSAYEIIGSTRFSYNKIRVIDKNSKNQIMNLYRGKNIDKTREDVLYHVAVVVRYDYVSKRKEYKWELYNQTSIIYRSD